MICVFVFWIKYEQIKNYEIEIVGNVFKIDGFYLENSTEEIVKTIEKDPTKSQEEALIEISKRLRPGEVFNLKAIKKDLEKRFYSTRRYDITGVGRYKFNRKLSVVDRLFDTVLAEDMMFTLEPGLYFDDEKI